MVSPDPGAAPDRETDAARGGGAIDDVERRERTRTSASEVSWALRDATRAAAEVDQVLAQRLGLRPTEYSAVNHIMTAARPIGPYDLSLHLAISSGSATELVDRLERRGHVERHRDPGDRRRIALRISEPSVGRVLGELAPLLRELEDVGRGFTDEELGTVGRYLRAAADVLRHFGDLTPGEPDG